MTQARTRVSYDKDTRARAKRAKAGLITISVTTSGGERVEEQMVATVDDCRFAKWIMTILFCDEVRKLPDIQSIVRKELRKDEERNE